jgi:hypothetical protein
MPARASFLRTMDQARWLASWIAEQLRSGAACRATVAGIPGEAMHVYGSIGTDAALTSLGEIWVGDYDVDAGDGSPSAITWRRTDGLERLGFIVVAARRFAALRALLPARPANAATCASCRATGDWHMFSADRKESLRIRGMICNDCGGMGWHALAPDSASPAAVRRLFG